MFKIVGSMEEEGVNALTGCVQHVFHFVIDEKPYLEFFTEGTF